MPPRGRPFEERCWTLPGSGRPTIEAAIELLEQRQTTAYTITAGLREAGIDPVVTGFLDNHLAVARFYVTLPRRRRNRSGGRGQAATGIGDGRG